ncbi:MAG: protein phosphatase 2C domain-containing protein [Paracoccaceae bacterium]|nr:protein phosphatase 2C domain-containing protein [Paracoccaceae bacterium]MDH5528506.1 protein phosphatase 2C domain-containing protein [Paracoccaceae bacterium]
MLWRTKEPGFDVALAVSQGSRDYQEDSVVADAPIGASYGIVVLADGMGGHAAGDVASKTVVSEVFRQLKFECDSFLDQNTDIPALLCKAAAAANMATMKHVAKNPKSAGMGSTLVSTVFVENRLFWVSIGDSPLFLFRDGILKQLNEDHSLGPQIDFLVKSGMLDAEAGKTHPNRNCLTSVIMGEDIAKTDCPADPFEVREGDIFIVASDGLQYLDNPQIEKLLRKNRKKRSCEIARLLLASIEALGDPNQDNVSFSVVKINYLTMAKQAQKTLRSVANLQQAPSSQHAAADAVQPAVAISGKVKRESGSRFAAAINGE